MTYEGRDFDDIYAWLLHDLLERPDHVCSPRGQKVNEILVSTLVLDDPRCRLLDNGARAASYGFASGEFLWYWNGKSDLKTMLYYNKRMKDFSDDGETLNSAYGALLKGRSVRQGPLVGSMQPAQVDQWSIAKRTLQNDPDSRRAILQIHQPFHQAIADDPGTNDVPCTLSLQFFVRGGRLDLHAHMRSNDAIWGLTYDLFSFTLLQECMLLELRETMPDLQLGKYYHTAGSMHIYERHFKQTRDILNEYTTRIPWVWAHDRKTNGMEPLSSLQDLVWLSNFEGLLREGLVDRINEESFTGCARWLAAQLNLHREKRDAEKGAKDV